MFSPPSIVKDALSISQSAALLLEDEQNETITPENLDNSTSSQVQFNLIPFNDVSNSTKLNYPSSLNYQQKMILLHNQQKLYSENVATACKTLRNQKHFVPITHNNRLVVKCEATDENQDTITYNPYANENDHETKFQLSKSIQYQNELNRNQCPIEIPLVRRFGQDRTNFYNILPKVETINKRLAVDYVKTNATSSSQPSVNHQQFNCFSLKDRISISSHYSKSGIASAQQTLPSNENSQSNDSQNAFTYNSNSNENLTFKNYDLNDEFWLNFDQ